MKRLISGLVVLVALSAPASAQAAERTVTLAVERMDCAACPVFVRSALRDVAGVIRVKVSYAARTATVTYDDRQARVQDLTKATGAIGYPSRPARSGQ